MRTKSQTIGDNHEWHVYGRMQCVYPVEFVGRVSGSGNQPGKPGDIRVTESEGQCLIFECKATKSDSIGVKLSWLRKLADQAFTVMARPVLSIQFVRGAATPKTYYILEEADFEHLLRCERELTTSLAKIV